MSNLLRLLVIGGMAACGIAIVALGLARHDADLLAPLNLMLFVLGIAVYLLPVGLAIYRDCKATVWIGVLDILLGWTVFGWVVALGWAASGRVRPAVAAPPTHPVLGH